MSEASEKVTSKNPVWWGLAVAIVVIAGAAAYRLATSQGGFSFSGGAEGFKLVSEAREDLDAATSELDELKAQLEAKEAALEAREAQLDARQEETARLLALVEGLASAAPSERAARRRAAQQQLAKLQAPVRPPPAATVDWTKFTLASKRIQSAHTALAKLPRPEQ